MKKIILLCPRDKQLKNDEFLYEDLTLGYFDGLLLYRELAKKMPEFNFTFDETIRPDIIWYLEYPKKRDIRFFRKRFPNAKTIVSVQESPSIIDVNWDLLLQNFDLIFSWNRSLLKSNHFLIPYPKPIPKKMVQPWGQRSGIFCMIAGNKYSFVTGELYSYRRRIINFFEFTAKRPLFQLFGTGWASFHFFGFPYTGILKRNLKLNFLNTYCGEIPDKFDCLNNYKFSFTLENFEGSDGYISEKIYDSIQAGCIPIYLGDAHIEDIVPPECFVDLRDFSSLEECIEFCENLSVEKASNMLMAGQAFLRSPTNTLETQLKYIHGVLLNEM